MCPGGAVVPKVVLLFALSSTKSWVVSTCAQQNLASGCKFSPVPKMTPQHLGSRKSHQPKHRPWQKNAPAPHKGWFGWTYIHLWGGLSSTLWVVLVTVGNLEVFRINQFGQVKFTSTAVWFDASTIWSACRNTNSKGHLNQQRPKCTKPIPRKHHQSHSRMIGLLELLHLHKLWDSRCPRQTWRWYDIWYSLSLRCWNKFFL